MRIIGNIDHPYLKITVFKMDNRLSIKLESGMYEETVKFRDGEGVDDLEGAVRFLDAAFLSGVEERLRSLHRDKLHTLTRLRQLEDPGFWEEII